MLPSSLLLSSLLMHCGKPDTMQDGVLVCSRQFLLQFVFGLSKDLCPWEKDAEAKRLPIRSGIIFCIKCHRIKKKMVWVYEM